MRSFKYSSLAACLCVLWIRSPVVVCGTSFVEEFHQQRLAMVEQQIRHRGITDPRVLRAMMAVPRHLFVPSKYADKAYLDTPLPIGYGQNISQPYIVAYMTEALGLKGDEKVLEIGTGSGYQTAILALLAKEVYSIEIIKGLADSARDRLEGLGYKNIHIRWGDGYLGWPEEAPFDAILLTAAPPSIPEVLLEQLKVGGRMVLPLGRTEQWLFRLVKREDGLHKERLVPVRFVPMVHGRSMRPH